MLKRATGPLTCIIADDLSIIHSQINEPSCTYTVVDKSAAVADLHQIRVTGNVVARIYWNTPGDVQLIVETGAAVLFCSEHTGVRLVASVRDRARLVVAGALHSIAPSVDTTSTIDTRRARLRKSMQLSFHGVLRRTFAFPHDEASCRRVDDDTPTEQQCGVCYERVKNAVFSPCNHEYMCLVCADRYQRTAVAGFSCPLCRVRITGVTPR